VSTQIPELRFGQVGAGGLVHERGSGNAGRKARGWGGSQECRPKGPLSEVGCSGQFAPSKIWAKVGQSDEVSLGRRGSRELPTLFSFLPFVAGLGLWR
jgi:hypothetical protein